MKPEIAYVYNKLKKLRFDFNRIDFENFRSEYRYEPTLKRYVRKDDNDLFIDKNTFKPLEEELEYADKCHNLAEQLGCPLEIVLKIMLKEIDTIFVIYGDGGYNSPYDDIKPAYVSGMYDSKNYLDLESEWVIETNLCPVPLKDYKKTWWLREDKSE